MIPQIQDEVHDAASTWIGVYNKFENEDDVCGKQATLYIIC